MKRISEQLKFYREKMGISQEALARHLNVSIGTIWNWEHDKGEPSVSQFLFIEELAMQKGVHIDD